MHNRSMHVCSDSQHSSLCWRGAQFFQQQVELLLHHGLHLALVAVWSQGYERKAVPLGDVFLQDLCDDFMLLHYTLVVELFGCNFDLKHGSAATACVSDVHVPDCQCTLQLFLYGRLCLCRKSAQVVC